MTNTLIWIMARIVGRKHEIQRESDKSSQLRPGLTRTGSFETRSPSDQQSVRLMAIYLLEVYSPMNPHRVTGTSRLSFNGNDVCTKTAYIKKNKTFARKLLTTWNSKTTVLRYDIDKYSWISNRANSLLNLWNQVNPLVLKTSLFSLCYGKKPRAARGQRYDQLRR